MAANAVAYEPPSDAAVRRAHHDLISGYLSTVERASTVDTSRSLARASFVRLAVGGQIKSKLSAIAVIYLQIREALREPEHKDYRDWLAASASGCREFAATMPSFNLTDAFRFVSKFTLPAALLAVFSAVKHLAETSTTPRTLAAGLAVAYLAGVLVFVLAAWRASFLRKRGLFGAPGETGRAEGARTPDVYALEDALFRALRRRKTREAQLDLWIEGTPIAILAFLFFIDPFRWTQGMTWHQWLGSGVLLLLFLLWVGGRAAPMLKARTSR